VNSSHYHRLSSCSKEKSLAVEAGCCAVCTNRENSTHPCMARRRSQTKFNSGLGNGGLLPVKSGWRLVYSKNTILAVVVLGKQRNLNKQTMK